MPNLKFKKNISINNSLINMMQTWQREWRNTWIQLQSKRWKRKSNLIKSSIRMKKSFNKRKKRSKIKNRFEESLV